jgi:hypothetical protein
MVTNLATNKKSVKKNNDVESYFMCVDFKHPLCHTKSLLQHVGYISLVYALTTIHDETLPIISIPKHPKKREYNEQSGRTHV